MESGATANPYLPPSSDVDHDQRLPAEPGAPLATRGQRLGGAIVDGVLQLLAYAIIYLGTSLQEIIQNGESAPMVYLRSGTWGYVAGIATLALSAVQWYFITRQGQSLGKMVARSRVVRVNGAPVGFLNGVVLRAWILEAPGVALPALGISLVGTLGIIHGVAMIVGILMIFGQSRRCLHDWIANTKVIDLAPDVPQVPPPRAA